MYYKVQLICHHKPHECRCRHNTATNVTQEELRQNLIKHNPALLKYLSKYQKNQQKPQQLNEQAIKQTKNDEFGKDNNIYPSIAEEKGLKFIIQSDDQHTSKPDKVKYQIKNESLDTNKKQLSPRVAVIEPISEITQKQQAKSKQKKNGRPQSSKQKLIKQHYKDLKLQSRYLSNTAFRKYFNRQCFQNYGRQNIHDEADGFVYGNYLKSHNINPHSGQNMPNDEETFYHALISASPDKYKEYINPNAQQQIKKSRSKSNFKKQNERQLSRQHEKPKLDFYKLVQDNAKHKKETQKYEHLRLKKSKSNDLAKYPRGAIPTTSEVIPSDHLKLNTKSPLQNQLSKAQQSNDKIGFKNSTANLIKNQSQRSQNKIMASANEQHTIKLKPQIPKSPKNNTKQTQVKSPKSINCNHSQQQQNINCACCMNQMKKMILDLAEKDPDLAQRIVTSAKKATLYKNYSLNNFENAAMNPHNYRSTDGNLNVLDN